MVNMNKCYMRSFSPKLGLSDKCHQSRLPVNFKRTQLTGWQVLTGYSIQKSRNLWFDFQRRKRKCGVERTLSSQYISVVTWKDYYSNSPGHYVC